MWARTLLAATLSVGLIGSLPTAAGELDDFNTAIEAFSSHHRVALGYLRTGNIDLAGVELDRMRETWGLVIEQFGARRPAAVTDPTLYTLTLTDMATRMIAARLVLDMGRSDVAGETLAEMRGVLARLRRASGIVVLADCVLDANGAMDALLPARDERLDLTQADVGAEILAKAAQYANQLKTCETIADPKVRAEPEFRRLIDGALASIGLVRQAVDHRDSALLGRLFDELRAFDRLLAFRFG